MAYHKLTAHVYIAEQVNCQYLTHVDSTWGRLDVWRALRHLTFLTHLYSVFADSRRRVEQRIALQRRLSRGLHRASYTYPAR